MHLNPTPQGLPQFRRAILDAIEAVKLQMPQSYIHLVYAPELADPLELVSESKREVSLIQPSISRVTNWPKEALPRIITLDCRRVAAYLLETDAGIDDPLMETSISQSYAETILQQRVNISQTNDDAGLAERVVCGWIVSTETAAQIALRINASSSDIRIERQKYWIRWYNPNYLDVLWPTLTANQKKSLLGENVWIAHDGNGVLKYFAHEPDREPASNTFQQISVRLDAMQWQQLDNVSVVQRLLQQWQTLCQEAAHAVKPDAQEQLHHWVHRARQSGLDGEDIAVYAITAMQMPSGFTESPEFVQLVKNAAQQGDKLSQSMPALSDRYWATTAIPAHAN